MKNRKVVNLRTHLGGELGQTSYDSVKHSADMEVTPVGVLMKVSGKRDRLIPWSNCIEAVLAPEAEEDEKPRGPGRPPGPRVA